MTKEENDLWANIHNPNNNEYSMDDWADAHNPTSDSYLSNDDDWDDE